MSYSKFRAMALQSMAQQAAARTRAAHIAKLRAAAIDACRPVETEQDRKRRLRSERARAGWARRKAKLDAERESENVDACPD